MPIMPPMTPFILFFFEYLRSSRTTNGTKQTGLTKNSKKANINLDMRGNCLREGNNPIDSNNNTKKNMIYKSLTLRAIIVNNNGLRNKA